MVYNGSVLTAIQWRKVSVCLFALILTMMAFQNQVYQSTSTQKQDLQIVPPSTLVNISLSVDDAQPYPNITYKIVLDPIFDGIISYIIGYFNNDFELNFTINNLSGNFEGIINPGLDVPTSLVLDHIYLQDKDLNTGYTVYSSLINSNTLEYNYGQPIFDHEGPELTYFSINAKDITYDQTIKIQANFSDASDIDIVWWSYHYSDSSWFSFSTLTFNSTSRYYEKIYKAGYKSTDFLIVDYISAEDIHGNENYYGPDELNFHNISVFGTYQTLAQLESINYNVSSIPLNSAVKVTLNITDPYPEDLFVDISFKDSPNSDYEIYTDMEYNTTSELFEGEFVLENPNFGAELFVYEVEISDPDRADLIITENEFNFPVLPVEGTTPDYNSPTISNVILTKSQAYITDLVTLSFDINEDNGLLPFLLIFINQPDNSGEGSQVIYLEAQNQIIFEFRPLMAMMQSFLPYGQYQDLNQPLWLETLTFDGIVITDANGNDAELINGIDYNLPDLNVTYPDSWLKPLTKDPSQNSETSSAGITTSVNSSTSTSATNSSNILPISVMSASIGLFITIFIYRRKSNPK